MQFMYFYLYFYKTFNTISLHQVQRCISLTSFTTFESNNFQRSQNKMKPYILGYWVYCKVVVAIFGNFIMWEKNWQLFFSKKGICDKIFF